ncbi:hypothetical protein N431DRAFT_363948 [Stipitochalara longipes BDJ]|nr:hypothetical protein N431DRAFT_363948 [Stipitochalara longipes BDJ]
MSGPTATDSGSEDVNDFLQRIKELGDRRDQEDEERNKKLEEEILQGRKERQARRAERARSISPTKSSPANTPTASRISAAQGSGLSQPLSPKFDPESASEPRRDTGVDDAMERLTGTSTKENTAPFDEERVISESDLVRNISVKASPSNAMPSRNSPLSWQRRPNSQSPERPRSRPLSIVAAENAARSPRATPEPTSTTEPTLSREEIAQSLASKDPAWFRQTADRGLNSKAYRRNQVEDEDRLDHGSSSQIQMPGMGRESSEPERAMDEPMDHSSSPSRSSAVYGSGSRESYQAPRVSGGAGSPLTLTPAHKLDPPEDPYSEGRGLAMSPSQGRISPERLDRPASPTKGMGGFVQSAIMKRSDSVKRWSVQSPAGLTRGDSTASNRSSQDHNSIMSPGGLKATGGSRPSSLSRDNSPHPSSRPASSHSNTTITQERPDTSSSIRSSTTTSTASDVFVKPSLPATRTQTPTGIKVDQEDASADTPTQAQRTPPTSPSKTMDPRRWSPTKSSWLESALNKPESPKPKPKTVPPPQQPAWMSEINKAKQRTSPDLPRSSTPSGPKHEVNIGGLMRSPPPGGLAKPLSIGGLPTGFSSGPSTRNRLDSTASQDSSGSTRSNDVDSIRSLTTSPTSKPSPTSGKVKPDTPPKKDFRANLKPRQAPSDSTSNEPEFKNVFGQLKRTKTQNYVAPDELKNNITRGKAALNITGGPKKTERKDEFKEAILKKKEDFKKAQLEGKGVTRSGSSASQDADVPEALAKRRALGRSGSVAAEADSASSDSTMKQKSEESRTSMLVNDTSASSRFQSKEPVGGKLAGRLNPGLAGLLARGPPSMASDASRSSNPSQRTVSTSTSTSNTEVPDSGPQLTHMTKGRARGPRRKAPSSLPTSTSSPEETKSALMASKDGAPIPSRIDTPKSTNSGESVPTKQQASTEDSVSQPASPRKLDMKRRSQFLQEAPDLNKKTESKSEVSKPLSPGKSTFRDTPVKLPEAKSDTKVASPPKPKPSTTIKSPSLSSKEKLGPPAVQSTEATKIRPAPMTFAKADGLETSSAGPIDSVNDLDSNKLSNNGSPVSVKNAAALWDRPSPTKSTGNQPRARSPIKLPTHDDERTAMIDAGLRPPSPIKGVSVGLGLRSTKDAPAARPLPTPPTKDPLSPPPSAGRMPSIAPTKSNESPVPQNSEASKLLGGFFGGDRSSTQYKVDTAAVLTARPDQGANIKTLRSTLYQLSPDGKKQQVPSHQERILFEGNLYLCFHTFGNAAGKKVTEIYYWLGDEVLNRTVDEGEVYAQKEARSAGAKLVTIRQGKETPEFLHALGGIIIIRRGSANRYDSLAPHILCCRKHLGQIVFDEVDFLPSSLCSGFPYLISTHSGKSYLWKGKGSGIEELSCARLIGMDFGLTGEIEEIEDGKEPPSFLQIFVGKTHDIAIPKSADHWRLKPNYTKYSTRLFRAHSAIKEQITEISPFCIYDLEPESIYVLDAFFEIYILVGSMAQSQFSAFQHSLMFAQEYGILAAGMEDRPFLPVTTCVLGGCPKDLRASFRKFQDHLSPTEMKPTGTPLQRGRSLRVLPLTAALEATRT